MRENCKGRDVSLALAVEEWLMIAEVQEREGFVSRDHFFRSAVAFYTVYSQKTAEGYDTCFCKCDKTFYFDSISKDLLNRRGYASERCALRLSEESLRLAIEIQVWDGLRSLEDFLYIAASFLSAVSAIRAEGFVVQFQKDNSVIDVANFFPNNGQLTGYHLQ